MNNPLRAARSLLDRIFSIVAFRASRSWDRPPDPVDNDEPDEFGPPGFNEDGLDAYVDGLFTPGTNERRDPTRAEGESGLSDYLVDRWLGGKMAASELCTIAFWAKAASATGFVEKLAFRPDAPSGHFTRHLRSVLKLERVENSTMTLTVPCYDKATFGRGMMDVPCIPPHEAVLEELSADPTIPDKLAGLVESNTLPPMITDHCVFKASRNTALPNVLYVDGVPFTKQTPSLAFGYMESSPTADTYCSLLENPAFVNAVVKAGALYGQFSTCLLGAFVPWPWVSIPFLTRTAGPGIALTPYG